MQWDKKTWTKAFLISVLYCIIVLLTMTPWFYPSVGKYIWDNNFIKILVLIGAWVAVLIIGLSSVKEHTGNKITLKTVLLTIIGTIVIIVIGQIVRNIG